MLDALQLSLGGGRKPKGKGGADDGRAALHAWGWNRYAALGCWPQRAALPTVTNSPCGTGRTLSLSRCARCVHSNGQLGSLDINSKPSPTAIRFAVAVNIMKVATGSRFSTAVDSEGRLWSWGAFRSRCCQRAGLVRCASRSPGVPLFTVVPRAVFEERVASRGGSHVCRCRDPMGSYWPWLNPKESNRVPVLLASTPQAAARTGSWVKESCYLRQRRRWWTWTVRVSSTSRHPKGTAPRCRPVGWCTRGAAGPRANWASAPPSRCHHPHWCQRLQTRVFACKRSRVAAITPWHVRWRP
jgi:hypothetical protein